MEKLKEKIKQSGLKQQFIADKIGVGSSHLTMMLNENAKMSEDIQVKINSLLKKYLVH